MRPNDHVNDEKQRGDSAEAGHRVPDEAGERRIARLGLGCVQLGMDYGVTNVHGQPDMYEASRILHVANGAGIPVIDTAAAYGSSEQVIGECRPRPHRFRIVTKTIPLKPNENGWSGLARVFSTFDKSLERLRVSSVYGLLVHQAHDLLGEQGKGLYELLREMKRDGVVRKIGASVYTASEIDSLLKRYDLDIVQVPFNAIDQRLRESGHLKRMKDQGIEIHARSAFLQGVLLAEPDRVDPYFKPYAEVLNEYGEWRRGEKLTPIQGALANVVEVPEIDTVIVGVTRAAELSEILQQVCEMPARVQTFRASERLRGLATDAGLVDPSQWRIQKRQAA